MKNKNVPVLLIAAGAFLFNSLFWNEQLAVNAVLFDAFLLTSVFFLYKQAHTNNGVWFLLPAHIICLGSIIIFNSLLSKISFSVTLLLLIAFLEYEHRSIWFACGSLLVGFFQFIRRFFRLLGNSRKGRKSAPMLSRFIRFAIIPLLTGIVFFIIYSNANTVFGSMAAKLETWAVKFFNSFFDLFSFGRLLFLLLGFYLAGALLLRASYTSFEKKEAGAANSLVRNRKKRMDINRNLWYDITVGIMGKLARGAMALKNEYKTGLISLALLNLLLLVINGIDINYLWIHFTYTPAVDLYTMIHEGTDLLILSIVLAMLVLLIFFRGNLNFYKQNKWLKAGAYAWLLQNAVLVISVMLRDYYYIREFGLAYKRIGVIFFLLLVITGLVSVFLKIKYAKTNYFLWKINAWCVVALLSVGSAVQWDEFIARYDIEHRQTAPLNLYYLLTLSDKVLPVLYENLPVLEAREKELNAVNTDPYGGKEKFNEILAERLNTYRREQVQLSWLSWNLADANQKNYFLKKMPPVALKNK